MRNIAEQIRYIGVDDLDLDLFENQYIVPEGMAYNSYLIDDEKIAVLDTVDARAGEAWKANLQEALDGREPDYLVIHHLEPDHSALAGWMLETFPGLKVVLGAKAVPMLGQFLDSAPAADRLLVVKEGDVLPLGRHSLQFYAAPMVHWPEVMVSFCPEEGILFSADAFGKFGALSKCGFWGDEDDDWACEGRRYYFNIVGKYGVQVQMLMKKLAPLPIKMIAALHGPVLREDLGTYLNLYQTWSTYGVETEGVFVAYASIHGGTAAAAEKLVDILKAKGCPKVAVSDLTRDDMAEAVEDAFRYDRLVLATTTYNAGIFPFMRDFVEHLVEHNYQNRTVGLVENGSWAPMAAKGIRALFEKSKNIRFTETTVTLASALSDASRAQLAALADELCACP